MMRTQILVTGGAGYIGSHTVVALLQAGFDVLVLDDFSNSSPLVLARIFEITGRPCELIEGRVQDRALLASLFQTHQISAVIHFAGKKAVGEGERQPFLYYHNNLVASLVLFEEMAKAGVLTLVFSSSATVYGDPGYEVYTEETPLAPMNVYGRTKRMTEDILRDLHKANPAWKIAILRYFNPVGAHPSGRIGEHPNGIPNNLMPFIAQVAVGKRTHVSVFGADYPTPDGTGLRDYLHVSDLAKGHLAALQVLDKEGALVTVNLGTGKPYSVLQMIAAFEEASGKKIPYEILGRRSGDLPAYYANPALAKRLLNWAAEYGIERMCRDTWRWQKLNPNGY